MNKITKLTLETAQNFAPDVSNNTKNAKSPATSLLLGLIGFLFIVFFNPVASFAQGPGVIQNIFTGSGVEYVQKLCGTGNSSTYCISPSLCKALAGNPVASVGSSCGSLGANQLLMRTTGYANSNLCYPIPFSSPLEDDELYFSISSIHRADHEEFLAFSYNLERFDGSSNDFWLDCYLVPYSFGNGTNPNCTWNPNAAGVVPISSTYYNSNHATGQVVSKIPLPVGGDFDKVWVRLHSGGGSSAITLSNIRLETRPNFLSIDAPNSICFGDALTLNTDFVGDAASTYTWAASTGVTLPTGQQIIVSPVQTTTYTVTATYANGHSQVASKTVVVNLIPSVTILGSNFCSGNSSLLTANVTLASPPFIYTWSDGATAATTTVLLSNTYTVTVSAAGGCTNTASKNIIAHQIPLINLEFATIYESYYNITDFNASFCPSNRDILTITDIEENIDFTYKWVKGIDITAPSIGNTPVLAIDDYLPADTYTILVTSIASGCTNTKSFTIPNRTGCCSNSALTIGNNSNSVTNISSVLNSPLFNNGWVVNGTLNIDVDVPSSPILIRMCAGSSIVVKTNHFLGIGSSGIQTTIAGMGSMWQGITVETGASLNMSGRNYGYINFSDAEIAIIANPNSKVRLEEGLKIFNCNIGLQTVASADGTRYNVDISIRNASFQGGTMLPPHLPSENCQVAIILNDANIVNSVGVNRDWDGIVCRFLDYGMMLHNSAVTMQNVSAVELNPNLSNTADPLAGTGFIIDNGSNVKFRKPSVSNYPSLTMFTIKNGILAENSDIDILDAGIYYASNIGLSVNGCDLRQIKANRSIFYGDNYGVLITRCSNSTIELKENQVHTEDPTSTGIAVFCKKNNDGNKVEIAANTINTLGNNGIWLNGCNNPDQYNIWNNTITIDGSQSSGVVSPTGILLENARAMNVCSNTISSLGSSVNSSNLYPVGIRNMASDLTAISCNNLDNCSTALLLQDGSEDVSIRANEFNNHNTGLLYSGTVSPTLIAQKNNGNTFLMGGQVVAAKNLAVDLATGTIPGRIFINTTDVAPTGYTYDAQPQATNDPFFNDWFGIANTDHEKGCTANGQALCVTVPLPHRPIKYGEGIALDILETPEFTNDLRWSLKYNLYKKLKTQPDSLFNNTILSDFVDSLDYTTMGKLAEVEAAASSLLKPTASLASQIEAYQTTINQTELAMQQAFENSVSDSLHTATWLARIDSLKTVYTAIVDAYKQAQDGYAAQTSQKADILHALNESLTPTVLQETNSKIVTEIDYRADTKSTTVLSTADRSTLEAIADECPYKGGKAVYEARNILARYAYRTYDNQAICAAQGISFRTQKPKTKKELPTVIKIYPNPATDFVIVETSEIGQIEFTDVLGRVFLAETTAAGKQIIDTQSLGTGLYNLKFIKETGESQSLGKIAIIKH